MNASKWNTILVVVLGMFFFGNCSTPGASKQDSLCKKQGTVEEEVTTILESMVEASTRKDYAKLFDLVDRHYAEDIVIQGVNPRAANGEV